MDRTVAAKRRPRNLLTLLAGSDTEHAQFPVGDPQISLCVLDHRVHGATRYSGGVREPVMLQVTDAFARGHPDSAASVFHHRSGPTGMPIHGRLLRIPPGQAPISRAEPHAAIPGSKNGCAKSIGRALARRKPWGGELAKSVEAIVGGNPDIPFAIFVDPRDGGTGESIGPLEHVRASVTNMEKAVVGSNPHCTVPVAEQRCWRFI